MNKKMHRFKIPALIFLISLQSVFAAEGTEHGNGGLAHVCRDANGKVKSSELLDLRKGRATYPGIQYSDQSYEGMYNGLVSTRLAVLPGIYRLYTEYFAGLFNYEQWGEHPLEFRVRYVDRTPVWSGDASEGIADPGCRFEQLGYYTAQGVLVVNRKILNTMDELSRSAFKTHEALYRIARKFSHATNSSEVQKLVAQLYNREFDQRKVTELVNRIYGKLPTSIGPARFFRDAQIFLDAYTDEFAFLTGVVSDSPVQVKVTVQKSTRKNGFELELVEYNPYLSAGMLTVRSSIPLLEVRAGAAVASYDFLLPVAAKDLTNLTIRLKNNYSKIRIVLLQDNAVIGRWDNISSAPSKGTGNLIVFGLLK